MGQLNNPVNFVIPERFFDAELPLGWPELVDGDIELITDEVLSRRCVGPMNNWIVIPYIYFRRAGFDVTHSPLPQNDVINIVNSVDFPIRDRSASPYIVATRADCYEPKIANWVFEQNNQNAGKPNVSWTPHFPQPGLIERDKARGTELKCLGYMGGVSNLYKAFRDDAFKSALGILGVEFRTGLRPRDGSEARSMHDYSEIDAVIAVRNLTYADVRNKPASKLVNAWTAGVPALMGPDPAYEELRKSPLDYIEVNSPEDAINGIRRLKAGAELYESMVENGLERAKEYTVSAILDRWIEHLNGPVSDDFAIWRGKNRVIKNILWLKNAAAHKASRQIYVRQRDSGERPFG